jgi:hypothetical protein
MSAGRPTDYSKEILEKAQEYLDSCQDEEVQLVKLENEEKGYTSYENKLRVDLPSIEGLARHLEVSRSTPYEWAKQHPEFSDILKDIKLEQAKRLINNGLSGDYNSTITKLILTKHGYSDKTELMGKDGKDLFPVPILNNMNVSNHDRDQENQRSDETDSGDSGRDLSE